MKKHILITGARGAGKTTLIRRLQQELACPVYGFRTVREKAGEDGFHPIYIHRASDAAKDYRFCEENMLGTCNGREHTVNKAAFDIFGAAAVAAAQPGGIIVMDELGFMEQDAETFKKAVLSVLDGDIPVIAAVKARQDIGFLREVCAHPNAELICLVPQERESVYELLKKRFLGGDNQK